MSKFKVVGGHRPPLQWDRQDIKGASPCLVGTPLWAGPPTRQCLAGAVTGTVCGTKSSLSPGTLKSNGQRWTVGSSSPKFPCPGGQGTDHSSVVACHGFRSVTRL